MTQPEVGGSEPQPPLCFIYTHLHDSIRAELDTLAQEVLQLQQSSASSGGAGLSQALAALGERYRFLEQVYKYHSSVEDEASCPARRRRRWQRCRRCRHPPPQAVAWTQAQRPAGFTGLAGAQLSGRSGSSRRSRCRQPPGSATRRHTPAHAATAPALQRGLLSAVS